MSFVAFPLKSGSASGGDFLADGSVPMTGEFVTSVGTFESQVADGATAVAYVFDTTNDLATGGAKLASWRSNGVEKAYIDKDGGLYLGSNNAVVRIKFDRGKGGFESSVGGVIYLGTAHKFPPCSLQGNKIQLTQSQTDTPSLIEIIGSTQNSANRSRSDIKIKSGIPHSNTELGTGLLYGGHLYIEGGDGASAAVGDAYGGDVYVRGGTGYGTGHNGYVIMDNLPTADPVVAGALWNDSGTLKVSAG